jgi:ligand-binding sensor domain-containing protein
VEYFPESDSFNQLLSSQKYRVTCILPAGDSLWFGTLAHGVRLLKRKAGVENALSAVPASSRIVGLAMSGPAGGPGNLFVATQNSGCYLFDSSASNAKRVSIPDSLLAQDDERANDIMVLRKIENEIWLGTRNNGCLIYGPDPSGWKSFTYYNGLISDQVRSLYDDADHIWIGCYGGFIRLDKNHYSTQKRAL